MAYSLSRARPGRAEEQRGRGLPGGRRPSWVSEAGERIVSDGWRMLLPPAGGSKAAAFSPIGKNKPRPAVAKAGTAAALRAGPAQGCNVAVLVDLHRVDGSRPREAPFHRPPVQPDRPHEPLRLWLSCRGAAGKAGCAKPPRLFAEAGRRSAPATGGHGNAQMGLH